MSCLELIIHVISIDSSTFDKDAAIWNKTHRCNLKLVAHCSLHQTLLRCQVQV